MELCVIAQMHSQNSEVQLQVFQQAVVIPLIVYYMPKYFFQVLLKAQKN